MVLILSRQNLLHAVSKIQFNIIIFPYISLKDVLPTELYIKPIASFVFTAVDSLSHSTPLAKPEEDGRHVAKLNILT
jgi:hypothetical protein